MTTSRPAHTNERFDLDAIKRGVDVVALAEYLGAQIVGPRSGRVVKCRCLAGTHEDRTPSMALYTDGNGAHCFSCGAHWNTVIDMAMASQKLGFREACQWLVDMFLNGVTPYASSVSLGPGPSAPAPKPLSADAKAVLSAVADFYAAQLWQPEHAPHLDALRARGLSDQTIRLMRLGYATGGDLEREIFPVVGPRLGLLFDLGLIAEPDEDPQRLRAAQRDGRGVVRRRSEKLARRITIPIINLPGEVLYMQGRATTGQQKAKYLGLADGLAHKVPMVVGRPGGAAIVVEGPFDLAALVQWGLHATHLCIASLGTGLSKTLAAIAEHHVTSVIHLTDQDAAGARAALSLAGELAERNLGCRVAVDQDRIDQLDLLTRDIPAGQRAELITLRTPPANDLVRTQWKALLELVDIRQLERMGWLRAVRWHNVAKDAGDLLKFRDRGQTLALQALG